MPFQFYFLVVKLGFKCLIANWQKLCHCPQTDILQNKNASLSEAGIFKSNKALEKNLY
jgi:hypothetical protein|tara:strand:- start:43253 stop:43426 length:174 start_codon:yes stop_codon:yes gene_type:complete